MVTRVGNALYLICCVFAVLWIVVVPFVMFTSSLPWDVSVVFAPSIMLYLIGKIIHLVLVR